MLKAYTESMNADYKWEMDRIQLIPLPGRGVESVITMARGSYPFSFPERGLPSKLSISDRIYELHESTFNPRHTSYLTRAELIAKSAELMISPDKDALKCRKPLVGLIRSMGELTENPHHQRIVFWTTHP